MQRQPGETRDSREILVQSKDAGAMLERNGRDESIYGCQTNSFGAPQAENRSGFAVGLEASGLKHLPLRKIMFYLADVPRETLKNLGDHYSGERKRLGVADHAPEFSACAARRGTQEIDPHRAIHQNQLRFLRMAFKSPFQIPVP